MVRTIRIIRQVIFYIQRTITGKYYMMTSSNGTIFRITGPLCMEHCQWDMEQVHSGICELGQFPENCAYSFHHPTSNKHVVFLTTIPTQITFMWQLIEYILSVCLTSHLCEKSLKKKMTHEVLCADTVFSYRSYLSAHWEDHAVSLYASITWLDSPGGFTRSDEVLGFANSRVRRAQGL